MTERKDWARFIALIEMADEAAVGKKRSHEALGLMFSLLERYSFESVLEAVRGYIYSGQRFVITVGDIIKGIEGDLQERAAIAWRMFVTALDRYGSYDSVRFPEPAYHWVVERYGGWEKLGEAWHSLSERDIEFRGVEWRKLYVVALREATWKNVPSYLPGAFERHNRENGFLNDLPDIIEIASGQKKSGEPARITAMPVKGLSRDVSHAQKERLANDA
jgi:hypothetical protein